MKSIAFFLFLSWILAVNAPLKAQHSPVTLPGTEMRSLHSDITGRDYDLYIKLPWDYETSDATYPVLFTTDANRTFPIYSTGSLIYETPGSGNQGIVIVGIGYPVSQDRTIGLAEWAILRNVDLRPERSPEAESFWSERLAPFLGKDFTMPETGHGAEFLEFIRKELIPFIEENYRVSDTDRGIAGYSLGGLFTLYALFNAPETFKTYFAGSPSLIQQCIGFESAYSNGHSALDAKVLITANDSEGQLRKGIQVLADSLLVRNYPGLTLDTCMFDNETHISGGAAAISRGLRELYYNQ